MCRFSYRGLEPHQDCTHAGHTKGSDSNLDEAVDRAAMNIKLGEARMAANAEAARSARKNKKKAQQAAWPLHPDIHET